MKCTSIRLLITGVLTFVLTLRPLCGRPLMVL